MPRRVDLPGADELFRPTAGRAKAGRRSSFQYETAGASETTPTNPDAAAAPAVGAGGASVEPTGRVKHDEKITVYVSSEELLALEQLRLTLRAQHGLAVDRGRIVRAAIAEALADVHAHGGDSALVRRLTER